MSDTIKTLLESLNDYTIQSEQILQEGTDSIDRILKLQARLRGTANCSVYKLTPTDIKLINKAKKIRGGFDYKVSTYQNIMNSRKYDIHAGCNIDFVISAIKDHMHNPSDDFDSTKVHEEAIAKTFRKITNRSYKSSCMTIDEFKKEYKLNAFGSYKNELIVIDGQTIGKLFEKSPIIIKYINENLINRQIITSKKYYDEVETEYNKYAKDHPENKTSLSGYVSCLDTAMRNTLIMYKCIRTTFYELNTEYRHVIGELIHIDKYMDAPSIVESTVNTYNSLFSDVHTLCESITLDDEDIVNQPSDDPSKLSDKSKSLLTDILEKCKDNVSNRELEKEKINDIISKYGLISSLSNDDLPNISRQFRIHNNVINKINMSNFISKLDNKLNICRDLSNNIEQLNNTNKKDIIKQLLSDTSFWTDDIPDNNSLGFLSDHIQNMILGKYIIINISNLDSMYDNILTIPDYLYKLNDHIISINKEIVGLITNIKNSENSKIELVMKHIINAYIAYSLIMSCIYSQLEIIENESIKLVQDLIDEINHIK